MQWTVAPSAPDWVNERLEPFSAARVASHVPDGFEAYARILHPVHVGDHTYRWAEVAAWSGATLEPSSTFDDIATRHLRGSPAQRWPGDPVEGTLPLHEAAALVDVLRVACGNGQEAGSRSGTATAGSGAISSG